MEYFNNGDIKKVEILNYSPIEYKNEREGIEYNPYDINEKNIGFSQEHSCVDDE